MYTLILGDCLEKMKDIPNKTIDMIITDPPYGISYKSNKQKGDTRKGKEVIVRDQEYFHIIEGDKTLNTEFISICFEKLKDNGAIYIFCHWSKWSALEKEVLSSGFSIKNMIVINKSNHGMGDLKGTYAPKHELVLFATKGRHIFNKEQKRINDVFDGKVLFSGSHRFHPNEKPISWLLPFIRRSCTPNGVVLDPFMGAGSAGLACLKLNRNFIGIEIDENFFNIAKDRINKDD